MHAWAVVLRAVELDYMGLEQRGLTVCGKVLRGGRVRRSMPAAATFGRENVATCCSVEVNRNQVGVPSLEIWQRGFIPRALCVEVSEGRWCSGDIWRRTGSLTFEGRKRHGGALAGKERVEPLECTR